MSKEINESSLYEKPITDQEMEYSKKIRECLKNKDFDELYKFLPKEVARIINSKYRIINVLK